MQIKSLLIKSYRSWRIDDRPVGGVARQRLKLLKKYWALRTEGCSEKISLKIIEVKRATLFRFGLWTNTARNRPTWLAIIAAI